GLSDRDDRQLFHVDRHSLVEQILDLRIAKRQATDLVDQFTELLSLRAAPAPLIVVGAFACRLEPLDIELFKRCPRLVDRTTGLPAHASREGTIVESLIPRAAGLVACRRIDARGLEVFDEHLRDALLLDEG